MWHIGVGPSQPKGKQAELPAEGPKAVTGERLLPAQLTRSFAARIWSNARPAVRAQYQSAECPGKLTVGGDPVDRKRRVGKAKTNAADFMTVVFCSPL